MDVNNENINSAEEKEEKEQKAEAKKPKTSKKSEKEAALIKENEELRADLAAQKDTYLRLCAEYDNFRKRTAKEKTDIYANATAKAVEGLLPVIDNFERALSLQGENADQGFSMMYTQFCEYLERLGVKAMETESAKFDPNMHIAVMHVEDKAYGENEIAEVLQKGYTLGDKVIRLACVKVAN